MCVYTFVRGYLAFPYVTFGLFPPWPGAREKEIAGKSLRQLTNYKPKFSVFNGG